MEFRRTAGVRRDSTVYHTSDGYAYHKNLRCENVMYMKCNQYDGDHCLGRARMDCDTGFVHRTKRHNHRPKPYFYFLSRIKNWILNEARQYIWESPTFIVRRVVSHAIVRYNIPRMAVAELHYNRLRSSIRRRVIENFPPLPHTLEELGDALQTHPNVTATLDMLDNVYAGSFGNEDDGTKCLLFTSRRLISFMRNVREVFADGTFKVCFPVPRHRQIYSIITTWRHHVVPLVWIVMQSKSQACYEVALNAVRFIAPDFNPRILHCDFEQAQQNAWQTVFNLVEIIGCYFHYVDSCLRNAVSTGLCDLVYDDEDASSLLRSFLALPLLPSDLIGVGLLELAYEAQRLDYMEDFSEFFEYFHRQWMPKTDVLSVFGALHRTNNACESHNRMIGRQLGRIHPMAFELLGAFVKCEEHAVQDLHSLHLGFDVSRKRRTSAVMNDLVIRNLTDDLLQGRITVLQFLHNASRRVQNVYDRGMGIVYDDDNNNEDED